MNYLEHRAIALTQRKIEELAEHLLVNEDAIQFRGCDASHIVHQFQVFEARWAVKGTTAPFLFERLTP